MLLLVVLGVLAAVFAVLAAVFFGRYRGAKRQLNESNKGESKGDQGGSA